MKKVQWEVEDKVQNLNDFQQLKLDMWGRTYIIDKKKGLIRDIKRNPGERSIIWNER